MTTYSQRQGIRGFGSPNNSFSSSTSINGISTMNVS